jgi:hypothetical protein
MPQVGFEHTIPEFERAKTVHALDRAATVIGSGNHILHLYKENKSISTEKKYTHFKLQYF